MSGGISGNTPGASRPIQGRREAAPKFLVAGTSAGVSRLPVVTSIVSLSREWNVSGVPQAAQKCRSATEELRNEAGSPRVQAKRAAGTFDRAANGPPTAFWHMRQWQTVDSGISNRAYRTAPHWQPPVIVGC